LSLKWFLSEVLFSAFFRISTFGRQLQKSGDLRDATSDLTPVPPPHPMGRGPGGGALRNLQFRVTSEIASRTSLFIPFLAAAFLATSALAADRTGIAMKKPVFGGGRESGNEALWLRGADLLQLQWR
jgi:hypothetical protein